MKSRSEIRHLIQTAREFKANNPRLYSGIISDGGIAHTIRFRPLVKSPLETGTTFDWAVPYGAWQDLADAAASIGSTSWDGIVLEYPNDNQFLWGRLAAMHAPAAKVLAAYHSLKSEG